MTETVYVNGKFLAQRTTGVQRVAGELLRALDGRAGGLPGRWVLLHPPGVAVPDLARVQARLVGTSTAGLHCWEQISLPAAARDGLLVNLSGSAPYRARRQACLIHDAALYDHPEAYARGFVLWYRFLFRRIARTAQPLMTVSAFSRQRLAVALKLPPEKLVLVPGASDHFVNIAPDQAVLDRLELTGHPYFLAVGSANPTKNLTRLVQAFSAVPEHLQARLVIVGGANDCVFRAEGVVGDPPSVLRIGSVDDAALKALYTRATALVFPSLYEGFGLPAIEAMACGCPVIAGRAAALPEVCGDAAMYVDPASHADVTQAMVNLMTDAAATQALRVAGLARARGYTWAQSANALLKALDPVLSAGTPRLGER